MTTLTRHTIAGTAAIAVITAALNAALPCFGLGGTETAAVVYGVFFAALNAVSLRVRAALVPVRSNAVTTFYLADKVARFMAGAALISLLVCFNRERAMAVGVMGFAYYIVAMLLEMSYFFAVERENKVENA